MQFKPTERTARALLVTTLVLGGLNSCTHRPSEKEQRFELKGKVVSVDKRGRAVTISHEAISGYMEAMAMPFKLKDERWLDQLAEGDRVQATLVVAGTRSWLEDLVFTHETVDQSDIGKSQSSIEPKPGDAVPDLALVNQNGKRVTLHRYHGQALLLTFIYTRCPLPDYCPLMTANFAEIEKALTSEPTLYAKTHLLSISVDPAYDTPKVLRAYAATHWGGGGEKTLSHWEYAAGSKEEVKKAATYFGLQYWTDGDQIVHSLRTAIIAPDGKLVKLYHGNEWKPAEIVGELRSLTGQANQQAAAKTTDLYHGVGVIESIDRELSKLQIDHEDIKDLMPAMNMPYDVEDKSLLDQVTPGEKVDFWLRSTSSGLVLVRVQKR